MNTLNKVVDYLKENYNQNGIPGLKYALQTRLNNWRTVPIHIAVTGQSGSGKSSFINALRDLNADEEGAAKVGVNDTTLECSSFPHPNNDNFLIWDLPGVGTTKFPKESYLKAVQFDRYDLFVIISGTRISENDLWLAKEIKERGKQFYFVRARFENDIRNKMRQEGIRNLTENEDKMFRDEMYTHVLEYCKAELISLGSENNIFIIDNYRTEKYDFQRLKYTMISDSVKKEAMIFTLKTVTKEAILEKKRILEERITMKAWHAALAPALFNVDVNILLEEKEFYRKQFGLDVKTLAQDSSTSQIESKFFEFTEKLQKADENNLSSNWLTKMRELVPFLPPVANQVRVYGFSKKWLHEVLDSMVENALTVHTDMAAGLAIV